MRSYGYPCEEYTVTTADGYIIRIFRIPYGRQCGKDEGPKKPVMMQHGLLNSCDDWIVLGEKCLCFILANQCYDVWIGNNRGTFYGRRHKWLDPNGSKFWDFCWHEMGVYDLPAMIDFILIKTGCGQLHYVGFSQGTTQFFTCMSKRSEYNNKIISASLLAPVAFMGHMQSLLRLLAPMTDAIEFICGWGNGEFLPRSDLVSIIGGEMCKDGSPMQDMCGNMMFAICGANPDQMNKVIQFEFN